MTPSLQKLIEVFQDHPVISTDTRKITPGCIFFALRGEQFDGNRFAPQALEAGASCVVTSAAPDRPDPRYLVTDDPLAALQQLAAHHRQTVSVPVIAVTGTNGKTTTKELIAAVLSRKYECLATAGNLNNHIGVPLTLLRLRPETGIAVVEMGANHPGEIDALCRIARPNFGIITNIGKAHLEGFGSFQGVISAKTELYRFIREAGERLFVNGDDPLLNSLSDDQPRIIYSRVNPSCYLGEIIEEDPFMVMDLIGAGSRTRIRSNLFGSYNADNILAAACIGNFFGVHADQIREAVETYHPTNNRSQVTHGRHNLLILDAYNANPSSMAAALKHFARTSSSGKYFILGDMLELGEESLAEHREIVRLTAELGLSEGLFVGPVFHSILKDQPGRSFPDSLSTRDFLTARPVMGKTILVKGSRGIRMENVEEVL